MSVRTLITIVIAGAFPIALALAACSPDGTYKGGGRGGTTPIQQNDSGEVDSGPDSGKDTGTPDTGTDTGPG